MHTNVLLKTLMRRDDQGDLTGDSWVILEWILKIPDCEDVNMNWLMIGSSEVFQKTFGLHKGVIFDPVNNYQLLQEVSVPYSYLLGYVNKCGLCYLPCVCYQSS